MTTDYTHIIECPVVRGNHVEAQISPDCICVYSIQGEPGQHIEPLSTHETRHEAIRMAISLVEHFDANVEALD